MYELYVLFFFLSVVLLYFSLLSKDSHLKSLYLFTSVAILILNYTSLVALRDANAGNDTGLYIDVFNRINSVLAARSEGELYFGNTEFLFWPFAAILKYLGVNGKYFIFIIAELSLILSFISIYKTMSKLGEEVFDRTQIISLSFLGLSLILFTYQSVYFGNHVRASIAVPLCIIALNYIRNFRVFLFISFIAVGFHWSAMIGLLVGVLCKYLTNGKRLIGLYLFTLMLIFADLTDIKVFLHLFSKIENIGPKINLYLENGVETQIVSIFTLSSFWVIFSTALVSCFALPDKYIKYKAPIVLYTFIVIFLSFFPVLSIRYFPFLYLVSIPLFLYAFIYRLGMTKGIGSLILLFVGISYVAFRSEAVRYTLGLS